jgi:hypothetical protein
LRCPRVPTTTAYMSSAALRCARKETMKRIPDKSWGLPGWTPVIEHESKLQYSLGRLSVPFMGSEVYRGLAEPHTIYVVHFAETRTYKVGVARHDVSRVRQHLRREGASLVCAPSAPNRYAAQIVEGLVLRDMRPGHVVVEDPLHGGTEHWDDRIAPPDLDALISSLSNEHRNSEWSRTVWRLNAAPEPVFRSLSAIAQRAEEKSSATVAETITEIESASGSPLFALSMAINDARERAGRCLISLAEMAHWRMNDDIEAILVQIGRNTAMVKGLERYRRELGRRVGGGI